MTYHGRSREGNKFTTAAYGYNTWEGAFVSWGGESHERSQFVYEEGTLVVDAWDAHGKNLVFRGASTQIFRNTAEKRVKQMEKALINMGKKFKKLHAGKKSWSFFCIPPVWPPCWWWEAWPWESCSPSRAC